MGIFESCHGISLFWSRRTRGFIEELAPSLGVTWSPHLCKRYPVVHVQRFISQLRLIGYVVQKHPRNVGLRSTSGRHIGNLNEIVLSSKRNCLLNEACRKNQGVQYSSIVKPYS
jgi:hypothetical protein